MSETKATPGPWECAWAERNQRTATGDWYFHRTAGPVVLSGVRRTNATAEANARLIAAAPELLAVCEALNEAHTTTSDHCALCGEDASADRHASGCLVLVARTAIAKAEGR